MIPAALALAPTAIKGILGVGQFLGGLGKRTKRPSMQVPQAINEAATAARMDANQTYRPGRTIAEDAIKSGSANALSNIQRTAGSASDVISAAGAIQGQQNKAMQGQDFLDMQYKDNTKAVLRDQLNNLGQWQHEAWDWNNRQAYDEAVATKSALTESGVQNLAGAATDLRNITMMDGLSSLFKQKTGSLTPINTSLATTVMNNRLKKQTQELTPKIGQINTSGLRSQPLMGAFNFLRNNY